MTHIIIYIVLGVLVYTAVAHFLFGLLYIPKPYGYDSRKEMIVFGVIWPITLCLLIGAALYYVMKLLFKSVNVKSLNPFNCFTKLGRKAYDPFHNWIDKLERKAGNNDD